MKTKIVQQVNDSDREVLVNFATKIVAGGFVPAEELEREFGPQDYTKTIAILFRTWRMLREVRRRWKEGAEPVLGYEWADRRFSKSEVAKMPPALQVVLELFKKTGNKYGDYEMLTVRCRWTNKAFGAMPFKEESGDELNRFDRDIGGGILIPAYCVRAMATAALPMLGKEQA